MLKSVAQLQTSTALPAQTYGESHRRRFQDRAAGAQVNKYEFLRTSIDASLAEVAILDSSGQVLLASASWKSRSKKAQGTKRLVLTDCADPLAFLSSDDATARKIAGCVERVLLGQASTANLRFTALDGKARRWFRLIVTPVTLGAGRDVSVVVEDITELHNLHRDNQRLTKQLLHSGENERRRIGREMHDSTVQDLVAISLNLARLKHLQDPAAQQVLSDVQAILARAQQDMRTFSFLLHPPLLDEEGLAVALGALVRGLANRMQIPIHLDCDSERARVSIAAEMALYRVAQEALINVHKHASGTYAIVRYYREDNSLVLEVEDDGVGIGGRYARKANFGVGILGMKARLQEFGGTLTLSRLAKGTMLKCIVPTSAV